MRKQDHLLQLIQSLTPAEKRYFTLQRPADDGPASYFALFDMLNRAETYDAAALSRQTGKDKKALAHSKEHLKDMLLRSLRNFHESETSVDLINRFLEGRLLRKKGLYPMVVARIEAAFEKALHYNEFAIAQMHARLLSVCYQETGNTEQLAVINRRELELLAATQQFIELVHLRDRCIQIVQARTQLSELKFLEKQPAFKQPYHKIQSWQGRQAWIEIHTLYYGFYKNDAKRALKLAMQEVQGYEVEPHFIEYMGNGAGYLSAISKLALAYAQTGHYTNSIKTYERVIDSALGKAAYATPQKEMLVNTARMNKLILLVYETRFTEALDFSGRLLKDLQRLPPDMQLAVHYYRSLLLLHKKDLKGCTTQLNTLLNTNTPLRTDIQYFARVLQVMLQIQLGNLQLVPYLVKALKAWAKRNKIQLPADVQLLNLLLNLANGAMQGKAAQKEAFVRFTAEIANPGFALWHKELALTHWKL